MENAVKEKKGLLKFAKKKSEAFAIIFVVVLLALVVLGFFIYNSYDISLSAYWIPRANEVGTADAIERIETFEKEKSEKVLYVNIFKDDYESFKKKNEDFVKAEADKISEQISALEKVDKIESYEMYSELYNHLNSIRLSDSGVLEKKIKAEVKNYDDYLSYCKDFDALVETYKVECGKCGGKPPEWKSCPLHGPDGCSPCSAGQPCNGASTWRWMRYRPGTSR